MTVIGDTSPLNFPFTGALGVLAAGAEQELLDLPSAVDRSCAGLFPRHPGLFSITSAPC